MTAPLRRREALGLIGAAALAPRFARAGVIDRRVALLGRGFNLPDQIPLQQARRPDRMTLKWLRERGMSHVRVPVRGECVMTRFSSPATIRATIDDFNRTLDLLLDLDFAVSADMHPGADFGRLHRSDPEAAFSALSEGWRNLSKPIERLPAGRVFAELLNEPQTDDRIWRAQAERLVVALRNDLPSTTFIVGPAPYQRVEALAAWLPLKDSNIVYAFHYYDPMAFTHQGLTWDASSPLSRLAGVPFPTRRGEPVMERLLEALRARGDADLAASIDRALDRPWNGRTIAAQFAPLADWSEKHGAPVILNEFGVLRFKTARDARLEWLGAVRETAQANRFGWAHWDYDQGFGLLDEAGRPDVALVDVLLPR
jgi:endoglucanase